MAVRKLPEVLEIDFHICDNSVNRQGWRLMVEGIDLSGFLANPVCIVKHETSSIPVGKWKNVRVEGEKLLGTVEFDKNDEFAVKLYWKYKDGFMNAVSLHVMPIEESDDPKLSLPGQRYSTVTKSDLWEISLVTVPGNKNAVKLSTAEGGTYKLNVISTNPNQKMAEEKKVETKDGNEVETLKLQVERLTKQNAKNLVDLHVNRGVVQKEEIESVTALAEQNYELVEKMLSARTVPTAEKKADDDSEKQEEKTTAVQVEGKKLEEKILSITTGAEGDKTKNENDRSTWGYNDWFKKDPEGLTLMAEKEPEKFKKLESELAAFAAKNGLVF